MANKNQDFAEFLELATPQLYRKNLFRVLCLQLTATTADARREEKRREMQRKLGVAVAEARGGELALSPPPSDAELRAALDRLIDPRKRLLDEVFWFWSLEAGAAADPALQAIDRGQVDEARQAWKAEARAGAVDVARHNLAVLDHLLALDEESAPAGGTGGDPDRPWKRALLSWGEVLDGEGFWLRLKDRVRELNDASVTIELAEQVRSTMPLALLSINAAFALQCAKRQDPVAARRHVSLLRVHDRQGAAAEAMRRALDPLRRQLTAAIDEARSRWKQDAAAGARAASELHERATALLALVDTVLDVDDTVRVGLHNLVSEALSDGAWAFANRTDDWSEAVRLLELARALAVGEAQQAKQDKELKALRENASSGDDWCAPGYWQLPADIRDQLEAIRAKVTSGDFDSALAALAVLDPGIGRPLRRAASYCLTHKGVRITQNAQSEYMEDPELLRTVIGHLQGLSEDARVRAIMNQPDPNTPAYLNPPCLNPKCPSPRSYTGWITFKWKEKVPLFLCSRCGDTHRAQIEGQKATFRKHIERALECLLVADAIDPGVVGVRRNLKSCREIASDLNATIPGDHRIAELCRSLLPKLPVTLATKPATARPAQSPKPATARPAQDRKPATARPAQSPKPATARGAEPKPPEARVATATKGPVEAAQGAPRKGPWRAAAAVAILVFLSWTAWTQWLLPCRQDAWRACHTFLSWAEWNQWLQAQVTGPSAAVTSPSAAVTADAAGKTVLAAVAAEPISPSQIVATGEWVKISKKFFSMGSPRGEKDERPVRSVTLSPYELGRTEITVGEYRKCVDARKCGPPGKGTSCNWGIGSRKDHPINCVDWNQANQYCEWIGARLPTEAEWEYGARGATRQDYPWGMRDPKDQLCWNGHGKRDGTCPVGSYPSGATPDGLLDMAGNVAEWTADWYGPYSETDVRDPKGPQHGNSRVVRGGGWNSERPYDVRAYLRFRFDETYAPPFVGFRCARTAGAGAKPPTHLLHEVRMLTGEGGEGSVVPDKSPVKAGGGNGGVPQAKWIKSLHGDRKKVFQEHEDAFPEYDGEPGPRGAAKALEWRYGDQVFQFKRDKLLKSQAKPRWSPARPSSPPQDAPHVVPAPPSQRPHRVPQVLPPGVAEDKYLRDPVGALLP